MSIGKKNGLMLLYKKIKAKRIRTGDFGIYFEESDLDILSNEDVMVYWKHKDISEINEQDIGDWSDLDTEIKERFALELWFEANDEYVINYKILRV